MSKFNTRTARPQVKSPVTSEKTPSGVTHEGGAGFKRDAKSELFLLAVSEFAGEKTFYEGADARSSRLDSLVSEVAQRDPSWLTDFLGWLRREGNLRTVAISAAVYAAHARLEVGMAGHSRQFISTVIQRADEPGEVLAAWTSRYGRKIPKPVKRGVADAVKRLYTERSLLKYDTDKSSFRFGDVIELVHPSPEEGKVWQGDLFKHAIDRRHSREDLVIPESLTLLHNRAELMAEPVGNRKTLLQEDGSFEVLRKAGMTWESLAGWLQGPMDARAWEAVIPSMGYMALLRNLRNFDEAGVSDGVAAAIATKLADPDEVAKSRQLPMRFLSAFRAAPSLRWSWALEQALGHALKNVPELPGRTLILVDRSGSMKWARLSERSDLDRADAAAIFGSALALRAENADLVQFGSSSAVVPFRKSESLLPMIQRFGDLGGTETESAIRHHFNGHDRIVIVTDEQASYSGFGRRGVFSSVPGNVRKYTWNLVGYVHGHDSSGLDSQHTFGGLSDSSFKIIPLLEAGHDGRWPWQN